MKQSEIVQLTGIIVLFTVCGCVYKGGAVETAGTDQPQWQQATSDLVSPRQLIDSDLEIAWHNELTIKPGETFSGFYILGDRLYILTSRNFLFALDRDNGLAAFSRQLTEPGFPVTGFDQYKNQLFTVAGGTLLLINPDNGADVSVVPLGFAAACPAVRNSSFFYVTGTDKRIRALRASDNTRMFDVAAPDGSTIISAVADENFGVFATDTGHCVGFAADAPKYLWKFDGQAGIVAPVVKSAESIFFSSKDTSVYKLVAATGTFVWKCPMGSILEQGPVVTARCVYQYSPDKGLAAIDRKTGKILWRLSQGVSLIAESDDKTYIASNVDGMIVIDNAKGAKSAGISLPGISKLAVNTIDSKIYIADDAGRIVCLKPIK